MCGLFGMAGLGVNNVDLDIINDLMIISALRGTDGTGLASGSLYRNGTIYKNTGDPYYWRWGCADKHLEDKIFNVVNSYFIGHCRKRTTGDAGQKGAQPFCGETIIGTHNGMIGWKFEPFHTDSAKLIGLLEAKKDIQLVVNETEASDAIALVWINRKDKTLNFYKNSRRPLYFAFNEKRSVLYWASELEMLALALRRNGVEYDPYYCKDNFHYSVKIEDIGTRKKIKAFTSKEITQPKAPEPAKVIHIGGKKQHPKDDKVIGETLEELKQIPWMRDNKGTSTPPWEGPETFDEYDEETRERLLH